jgi:hypothetical protein
MQSGVNSALSNFIRLKNHVLPVQIRHCQLVIFVIFTCLSYAFFDSYLSLNWLDDQFFGTVQMLTANV